MQMLEAIDVHGDRLKAAAMAAGPQARVRNCPEWTVLDLVKHLTGALSYTVGVITDRSPELPRPEDWTDALGCWDGQRLALREALRRPPGTPVRSPFPYGGGVTVGDLARRLAHETALHRLDAESALPDPPATRFAEAFATDGVDEYLTFLAPRRSLGGDGIVRIETGGRTWTVVLRPGEPPALGDGEPGLTLTGEPNDVYLALWGRPHAARITGDTALLEPLAAP